jgi:hypothetical protein
LIIKKDHHRFNENDPDWIKELADGLEDRNISNFSDDQKRILREQFLENLNNGFKPKDAILRSLENIESFDE